MSSSENRDPRRVREMFGAIAPRYDLLNHLLSLSLDRLWRRRAVRELAPEPEDQILDLCAGTGDLTVELARSAPDGLVVCCDFSHPMLVLAAPKLRRKRVHRQCALLEADGLRLPFAADTFDVVTVSFGVRNFADMDKGLREILRVLQPGGKLVILEFSSPDAAILSALYRLYLKRILPRLGDRVSGCQGPYGYLASTISEFPEPASLAGRIREVGFAAVGWTTLSGGIVAIHTAMKQAVDRSAVSGQLPSARTRHRRAGAGARPSGRGDGSLPAGR